MSSESTLQTLSPSALGTKSHWNNIYARELSNHAEDPSDEGTIWFEECGAEERMLNFLSDLQISPNASIANEGNENLSILDVGTGNGHMLFEMREAGWKGRLLGVDYSNASVELARKVAMARNAQVDFEAWDVLRDAPGKWVNQGFEIVLDKGTFDAISLSDEVLDERGRKGCEIYAEKLAPVIKDRGFLLVTSCNWTEDELRMWFGGDKSGANNVLRFHESIAFPSFQFGGQKGQSVSCVCFRKEA